MGTEQLVGIDWWTLLAQIINLFIQVWLIKKFLFKPINNMLEKRKQLADKEIEDARTAREQALTAKQQYEQSLSTAQQEATRIVQDAQKQAQQRADQLVRDAQEEASGIKAQAEADIAQQKKKALNEAKDEIGGLAMDIAGKVVEKEIKEEDHRKLIDEFIDKVGEAS